MAIELNLVECPVRRKKGDRENRKSGANPERCRRCNRVGITQVKAGHRAAEKACVVVVAYVTSQEQLVRRTVGSIPLGEVNPEKRPWQ